MSTNSNTNFEMLVDTVNTLKYSQGFYGRIAKDLSCMEQDKLEEVKDYINKQPKFNDFLDVVMFLEG